MKRSKKKARKLRSRIRAWENISKTADAKAFRKPGSNTK